MEITADTKMTEQSFMLANYQNIFLSTWAAAEAVTSFIRLLITCHTCSIRGPPACTQLGAQSQSCSSFDNTRDDLAQCLPAEAHEVSSVLSRT